MTHLPPDARPPAGPTPLEYGKPPSGLPFGWQAAIGALIASVSVTASAFVGVFVGMAGVVGAPAVLAIGFVLVAIMLRRRERTRGWAIGFFIGLGIGVLIQGACWVALSNMRIGG